MDLTFLQSQAMSLEMGGLLRLLGEYRGKQELFTKTVPHIINTLKEIAIIQSTESSNRMEGVVVPNARLQELMHQKTTPKNRSEAEVVGYRDVLARIHTTFNKMSITPKTILDIHRDMFKHTEQSAGIWKRKDNTIEERLPDGRWITRFVPVSAQETPYYMEQLCGQFHKLSHQARIDPLLLIHTFILDFLCIHPFSDGNGRVSRLLNILMLHQAGYMVGRYISIERLIEESKESYYNVLQRCSQNWHQGQHRLLPWWEFCMGILIPAYREFENRVGTIRTSHGAKSAWVREAVENLPGEFSIQELMQACPGVSRPMIRVVLEELRKDGKIRVSGVGRNATWKKSENRYP